MFHCGSRLHSLFEQLAVRHRIVICCQIRKLTTNNRTAWCHVFGLGEECDISASKSWCDYAFAAVVEGTVDIFAIRAY